MRSQDFLRSEVGLLLVLAARPEFRPPWAPRSYMTQLTLTRLTRPQSEEMVLRVTGGSRCPPRCSPRPWPKPMASRSLWKSW
jgi:hypothetical protein